MLNMLRKRAWPLTVVMLIATMLLVCGVGITDRDSVPDQSIQFHVGGDKVITLGHVGEALAAGDVDYTFDGVDDNAQFTLALNALPATGGRLVIVSAVQVNFSATVTRAIDNVTIIGSGAGTYFANDGVTPLFTAGGSNWVFQDLSTDAGSINMGATTEWMWTNVTVGATYYAYRSPYGQSAMNDVTVASLTDSGLTSGRVPVAGVGGLLGDDADLTFAGTTLTTTDLAAPVGRGATYVVAASTATADQIAQSDYICDGTADEIQINAAIVAANGGVGGTVMLTEGTYTCDDTVEILSNVFVEGQGFGTILTLPNGANIYDSVQFAVGVTNAGLSYVKIDGNGTNQGANGSIGLIIKGSVITVHDVWVTNTWWDGIEIDTGHTVTVSQVWVSATGVDSGCGIELTGDFYDIVISDFQIWDCADTQGGILFSSHAGDAHGYNVVITGGTIYNCARGISVAGTAGTRPFEHIKISQVIIDTTTDPGAGAHGLYLDTSLINHCEISHFEVKNTGVAGYGVYVTNGTPEDIVLSHGLVFDATISGYYINAPDILLDHCIAREGLDQGFETTAASDRVKFISCEAYDHRTAGKRSFTILGDDVRVIGCYSYDAAATGFFTGAPGTQIIGCTANGDDTYGFDVEGDNCIMTGCTVVNGATALYMGANDYLVITENDLQDATTKVNLAAGAPLTTCVIANNTDYIAPGEIRSVAKAITAGVQNTVTSIQNTFGNDVMITEAYVNITTAASATNPTYDMGTDDDGAGAPSVANNLFNAIPDTVGYYRSLSNGLGGAVSGVLVQPIIWQFIGNDWVNFIIIGAAGADTAGTIFVTVMGL